MATAPQSAYRSYVGVAKDTVNAILSAGTAVGATALPLTSTVGTTGTLTTSGATYTAFIVDGPNSEAVACSGNLSGGNIAVAATLNAHPAGAYVFFQLTASLGPTAFIPVTKVDMTPKVDQLYDKGYRGSQATAYSAQQGMRIGDFQLEGNIFADTLGYILAAFFGSYDYTASSGANPNRYAFSPQNSGNGQPASYLFYDYVPGDGVLWVYSRAILSDLTLKFDAKGLATWQATGMALAPGQTSLTPSPTFSSFSPIASRSAAITAGGTYTPDVISAEYAFKREEFEAVYTLAGLQDPLAIFSGPVDAKCKFTMVMADDTQLNYYLNGTQPTFDLAAFIGVGAAATDSGVDIHTNVSNYEDVKVTQTGKAYVTLDGGFTAIANTTDATTAGGGLSPAKVTIHTKTAGTSTQY